MGRISKRTVDAARAGKQAGFHLGQHLARFRFAGAAHRREEFRLPVPRGRPLAPRHHRQGRNADAGPGAPHRRRHGADGEGRRRSAGGPAADRDALTVAGLLDRYVASARYAQKAATTQTTGWGRSSGT